MLPKTPYILCVDDDEDDLFFITAFIQQEYPWMTTVVASDGVEALRVLTEAKQEGALPRLVLLDINMPRMNGKEALTRIKADRQLSAVPISLLTTSDAPSDRLFCAHYGVDMISKPDQLPELQRALRKLINHTLYH